MDISSTRELLKVLQGQHWWAMRLSRDPGPVGLSVSPSLECRPPPELRVPATMQTKVRELPTLLWKSWTRCSPSQMYVLAVKGSVVVKQCGRSKKNRQQDGIETRSGWSVCGNWANGGTNQQGEEWAAPAIRCMRTYLMRHMKIRSRWIKDLNVKKAKL